MSLASAQLGTAQLGLDQLGQFETLTGTNAVTGFVVEVSGSPAITAAGTVTNTGVAGTVAEVSGSPAITAAGLVTNPGGQVVPKPAFPLLQTMPIGFLLLRKLLRDRGVNV